VYVIMSHNAAFLLENPSIYHDFQTSFFFFLHTSSGIAPAPLFIPGPTYNTIKTIVSDLASVVYIVLLKQVPLGHTKHAINTTVLHSRFVKLEHTQTHTHTHTLTHTSHCTVAASFPLSNSSN